MGSKRKLKKYLTILVILALAGGGGLYVYKAESEQPLIRVGPPQERLSPQTALQVEITDQSSGLKSVRVEAVQKGKSRVLAQEEFVKPRPSWAQEFSLAKNAFAEGPVQLQVTARDRSWRNWLQGNKATEKVTFVFDSKPPRVSLESFQHNLHQGGTGVVAFRVSEPVQKAGVQVKDAFFPAYPQSEDLYLCFFSFPFYLEPDQGRLLISVTDLAGNANQAGFHHYVNDERYSRVKLPVSDRFLQNTIVNFQDLYPNQDSLVQVFLKVNRELRQKNRDQLLEFGRKTAHRPLWSGRFLRQPGAARRAHFGTHRKYVYKGQVIDQQTHLGVDLASVARAEVPAANAGKVVFADWLGIYGQVIVVDHGLGLQSLYAHLSQMQVQTGDEVSKGQIIARTGSTGLAGGDHLHFAILVSGVPVNPVEWWDQTWIDNNIMSKLSLNAD